MISKIQHLLRTKKVRKLWKDMIANVLNRRATYKKRHLTGLKYEQFQVSSRTKGRRERRIKRKRISDIKQNEIGMNKKGFVENKRTKRSCHIFYS